MNFLKKMNSFQRTREKKLPCGQNYFLPKGSTREAVVLRSFSLPFRSGKAREVEAAAACCGRAGLSGLSRPRKRVSGFRGSRKQKCLWSLLRKKGSPQTYRDKGVECGLNFAETLKNGELGECLKMIPKFAECADFCPLEDSLETRISTAFPRIKSDISGYRI